MAIHFIFSTCRFIYWTEDIPTGRGLLHRLNLRDTASTTSATFGSIAERRKRSQRIRSKRQTQSLSSITLNPALAQDVMTGELLLSDSTSGDIMRCNLTDSNCVVEVDHADLLTTTGRGNVGMYRSCVYVAHVYYFTYMYMLALYCCPVRFASHKFCSHRRLSLLVQFRVV